VINTTFGVAAAGIGGSPCWTAKETAANILAEYYA